MMEQTTTQVIAKCPHCGSKNVYGMSRVVGYFSRIDNWNSSKRAEFKDRQKGRYKL
jgi:ribonucleoside-triphosphate reductase